MAVVDSGVFASSAYDDPVNSSAVSEIHFMPTAMKDVSFDSTISAWGPGMFDQMSSRPSSAIEDLNTLEFTFSFPPRNIDPGILFSPVISSMQYQSDAAQPSNIEPGSAVYTFPKAIDVDIFPLSLSPGIQHDNICLPSEFDSLFGSGLGGILNEAIPPDPSSANFLA